jgi:RNA polymerase sigma-70 factor (ECF subfamily)
MTGANDSETTRPSLLLRVRDPRDEESWRAFVDMYAPLIVRYARSRRLQEADAADVCQEVLAQVAKSIRGFEYQPERGRFRDWLGTVTRNRVNRFFTRVAGREQAIGEALADELPAPEQDREWDDAFNTHVLQVALERVRPGFEPKTWEAFRLVWLAHQPAAAVAERLGMPVAGVYLAKSRVLARLRAEVLAIAEDFPLEPAGR